MNKQKRKFPIRLGQKVFIMYNTYRNMWFNKSTVYMRNNEAFITHTQIDEDTIDECRCIFKYEDYGKTWFKTLKEVKAYLDKEIGTNYTLKMCEFQDEDIQYDIFEKEA